MTTEVPNEDQTSSTDVVSSLASASADLWGEVLQLVGRVEESRQRLTHAVDHLEEVAGDIAAAIAPVPVPVVPEIEEPEAAAAFEEPEPADVIAAAEVEVPPAPPIPAVAEAPTSPEEPQEVEGPEEPPEESITGTGEVEEPWIEESSVVATYAEQETSEPETAEEPAAAEAEEVVAVAEADREPEETAPAGEEPKIALGAPAALTSEEPGGALAGIRVLSPERVVDMEPAVVDALLAAEFGEAAARIMDPEALTLDALLGEEFGTKEREGTAETARGGWSPPAPLPPAPKLPRPPSQPLPPPPSGLPPPPRSDVPESSRPTPLQRASETPEGPAGASTGVTSLPYVQVSPPPLSFDSPPLPARTSETVPAPASPSAGETGAPEGSTASEVVQTSEPTPPLGSPKVTGDVADAGESTSDIPPLSFDSPVFTTESALPVEAPPIPEAEAESRSVSGLGIGNASEQTSPVDVGLDLPPLSFDSPMMTAEPSPSVQLRSIPAEIATSGALEAEFADSFAGSSEWAGSSEFDESSKEASPFEVASELPPLSFDSPVLTGEAATGYEPETVSAPLTAPDGELELETPLPPPPLPTDLASEILAASPAPASLEPAQDEEPVDQSNVVSQDFTIISKKHRRFHIR